MSCITQRLSAVRQRIESAISQAGRAPGSATLLAVSKTFPAEAIRDAYAAGQRAFAENYVQEALDKIMALAELRHDIEWHFIGPLQSNKTRRIAEQVDWVHSIDRLKIAQRLSDQRPADMPPLNVCIQVNISGEATKSGVTLQEAPPLAHQITRLPKLRLRGLMAIPEPMDETAAQRTPYRRLHELFDRLNTEGLVIDTLSIGMSTDLEAAILEGATMVRIGTAIFGPRFNSHFSRDSV